MVKHYGDNAVTMPPRYYEDSIITKITNGKESSDTIWHKVGDISLQNQLGNTVSLNDLKGKVIVADFFFTRCPSICPYLTRNMRRLQNALKLKDDMKRVDTTFVQFLSFSVDPERDSVPVLKKYADKIWGEPGCMVVINGAKEKNI